MNIRLFILSLLLSVLTLYAQNESSRIYGVTIDGVDRINRITEALGSHSKKMTARVVFNERVPAKTYLKPCEKIHEVSYIMGELLDSYGFAKYSVDDYKDRVDDYINTLGDNVDIWEIGNEANGEWLGDITGVIAKIKAAYDIVRADKKKTALTLYYNTPCPDKRENEMFTWVNEQLDTALRNNLDYVFVSYYEDDCNDYQPNWQTIFDTLHTLFPNSKLGIGECGSKYQTRKAEYITRYYSMYVTTPGFIGGYFWWYYREDCVPYTKKLWRVLENSLVQ